MKGGSISALCLQKCHTPFGEDCRTAQEMRNLDVVRVSAALSQNFVSASTPWLWVTSIYFCCGSSTAEINLKSATRRGLGI